MTMKMARAELQYNVLVVSQGGASGHETDKISPSSPPGAQLLARGTNPERKW